MSRSRQQGFTLIELTIALTLLALLIIKLTMVLREASEGHHRGSVSLALEDQAQIVLDRIAYAVIGSDPDTLLPDPSAPFFTDEITYQVSLGVQDGEVVWSDLETIGLNDPSLLYWAENKGEAQEKLVVWSRHVAELFADEVDNGFDDNGNLLADETGLSFVVDGDSVTIRLTLERQQEEGEPVRVTKETVVTCRN